MRPQQFFSHLTAARLWHLPLPTRFDEGELLDVSTMDAESNRPRCQGVRGHRLSSRTTRVVALHSMRVTDVETVWCTLAAHLSLDDVIVLGDAIVFVPRYPDRFAPAPRPYSTPAKLSARVRLYRGAGKSKLLDALESLRVGSASPMETRLRLLLVRSGLPEPELNVDILDAVGTFVACGDLYYPDHRVLVEYDGDQHRTDTATYERDQSRIARLQALNVRCIRVRKAGFFRHPERTVEEIRTALQQDQSERGLTQHQVGGDGRGGRRAGRPR